MNNETRTETSTTPSHRLLLVGEGLHVMNPALVRAIEERDEQWLIDMARSQGGRGRWPGIVVTGLEWTHFHSLWWPRSL